MRIAVMLRCLDERGGVSVYARNVVEELLRVDDRNHYVLLYRSDRHRGAFGTRPNVTERVLRGRSKAWWDQVAVPVACWRERADVVFHPKFTVPFLAPCPAVMVVHGADWFLPDQARFYGFWDVRYVRAVMPLYFRRAAVVLSVSELTSENFQRVLRPPPGRIRTVYFAPARHFRRVEDEGARADVRRRYGLPERFILTLTKRGGGERKNLDGLLRGYARYHEAAAEPAPLVVGGQDCGLFAAEHGLDRQPWGRDVLFPGWIDQADLPAVFSSAALYLYPSNLEAFPIPLTEAMACGTPIVTSRANGLEEIAGDAALLVDPSDPAAVGEAVGRVMADPALAADLSARGLARSRRFTWDECARRTLAILEEVHRGGERPPGPGRAPTA
jgi:glycosyltransferase involved in cell wall biosynthesis